MSDKVMFKVGDKVVVNKDKVDMLTASGEACKTSAAQKGEGIHWEVKYIDDCFAVLNREAFAIAIHPKYLSAFDPNEGKFVEIEGKKYKLMPA